MNKTSPTSREMTTPSSAAALLSAHPLYVRIVEKIRNLSLDPHPAGSKKLSGQEKYKIQQGNYRILYQIIDEQLIINVVKVRHRRDVYGKLA